MDENQASLRLLKSPLKNANFDQRLPFKNISNHYDTIHENIPNGHLDQVIQKVPFGKFDASFDNNEDNWKERTEVITKETHQKYISYSTEVVNEIITEAMNKNHSQNGGESVCISGSDKDPIIKPDTENKLFINKSDDMCKNFLLSEPALELLKSFENMGISTPTTRKISKERAQYMGESRTFNPFVKSCSSIKISPCKSNMDSEELGSNVPISISGAMNLSNSNTDVKLSDQTGIITVLNNSFTDTIATEFTYQNLPSDPVDETKKLDCDAEGNIIDSYIDPFVSRSAVQNSDDKSVSKSNQIKMTFVENINNSSCDPFVTKSIIQNLPSNSVVETKKLDFNFEGNINDSNIDNAVKRSPVHNSPDKSDSSLNHLEVTFIENMNNSVCDPFVTKSAIKNSPCKSHVDSQELDSTIAIAKSASQNFSCNSDVDSYEQGRLVKDLNVSFRDPIATKSSIQNLPSNTMVETKKLDSNVEGNIIDSNIDNSVKRSAVHNSPDKSDSSLNHLEVTFLENMNNSVCDPFVTKSTIKNSPCKSHIDSQGLDSTIAIAMSAPQNFSCNPDVDTYEQGRLVKDLNVSFNDSIATKSSIQNLPSNTVVVTKKLDSNVEENIIDSNSDKSANRSAVHNSPDKSDSSLNHLEVTVIENMNNSGCDPFVSESTIKTSSYDSDLDSENLDSTVVIVMPAIQNLSCESNEPNEQVILGKNLNDKRIDSFIPKSNVVNSPCKFGVESKNQYFTPDENVIDTNIDPLVTRSAFQNSPNKSYTHSNKLDTSIGNLNTCIENCVTKSTSLSDPCETGVNIGSIEIKSLSNFNNGLCSDKLDENLTNKVVESNKEELILVQDFTASFCNSATKSTIENSPFKSAVEVQKTDSIYAENITDPNFDPFITISAVHNSPVKSDTRSNQIKVTVVENMDVNSHDPIVTKSTIKNSPCKSDVYLGKRVSTVVFTKPSVENVSNSSEIKLNDKKETIDITLIDSFSDPIVNNSTIQNLPSQSIRETKILDFKPVENTSGSNIDSLDTRSAVHNSPDKCAARSNQIDATVVENVDDSSYDPFVTKSTIKNSPCKSDVDCEKSDITVVSDKSSSQNVSIMSEIKLNEQNLSDSNIDPFVTRSAVYNTPDKSDTSRPNLLVENRDDSICDPFVTKSTIKNSPCKSDVDCEKSDITVVSDKSSSQNVSNRSEIKLNVQNLSDSNIDPFVTRFAVQSTPDKSDTSRPNLLVENRDDSSCDPLVTKSTIKNSPCKSDVDCEKSVITVVSDKSSSQNVSNRSEIKLNEQQPIVKTLNDSFGDPTVNKSILNMSSKSMFETKILDSKAAEYINDSSIDPFVTRSAVHNSPDKSNANSNQLEETFFDNMNNSEYDPFVTKSTIKNSPSKSLVNSRNINATMVIDKSAAQSFSYNSDELNEQESFINTLNNFNEVPIETKSTTQIMPSTFGVETKILNSLAEESIINSDVDPFVTTSAVQNSPNKPDANSNQFVKIMNHSGCDSFVAKNITETSPSKSHFSEKLDSTVCIAQSHESDEQVNLLNSISHPFITEPIIQNSSCMPGVETKKLDSIVADLIDSEIETLIYKSGLNNSCKSDIGCNKVDEDNLEKSLISGCNNSSIDEYATASSMQSSLHNTKEIDNIGTELVEKFSDICIDQVIDEADDNNLVKEPVLDTDMFIDTTLVENSNIIKSTSIIHGSQCLSEEKGEKMDSTFDAGIVAKNSFDSGQMAAGTIVQSVPDKLNTQIEFEFSDSTDFELNLQNAEKDKLLDDVAVRVSNVRQSISSIEFDKIAIEAVELASVASQNIPECMVSDDLVDSEEFSDANDFFCNNEELDELSGHGIEGDKKNLIRNSLFVKFDPLVAGRKSLAPFLEKERIDVLDPRRESSLIFFSPAKKKPILSSTMNISGLLNDNADQTLVRIDESSLFESSTFDNTILLNDSNSTMVYRSKSLCSNGESSFSSVEVQTENEVVLTQDHQAALRNLELAHQGVLLRKSQEFEKMQKNLKDEIKRHIISITSLTEENTKMKKTSGQLLSLLQQIKDKKAKMESEYVEQIKILISNHSEEVDKLKKENLQKQDELQQSETSLFDFFKKYERMRQVVEALHRNEELIKKENEELRKEIDEKTARFKSDYTKVEDKLKEVILKIEEEEKVHLHEKGKAALLFKRAEMKILSLTEDVAKKQDEIKHLTDLLDEFGQKLG